MLYVFGRYASLDKEEPSFAQVLNPETGVEFGQMNFIY